MFLISLSSAKKPLFTALSLVLLASAVAAQPSGAEKTERRAERSFGDRQGTPKTAILLEADGSQGEVIHYIEDDGVAYVGGDIVIHVNDHGHAALERSRLEGGLEKGAALTGPRYLWPGGVVPYTIDSALSSEEKGWIDYAIAEWETETQIRLVPRTDEADYLFFSNDNDCASYYGRQGGEQEVWIGGCWNKAGPVHEIGHAIGLFHEQSRADRDDYVSIQWNNIESGTESNFITFSANGYLDAADLGPYDFQSIMHYGCWAGSKNGKATIVPVNLGDVMECDSMGEKNHLSTIDIFTVDRLYPDLQMVAINKSGGRNQGKVLYDLDQTDASSSNIGRLSGSSTCATDIEYVGSMLYGLGCEGSGAGSTIFQINSGNAANGSARTLGDADGARLVTAIAADPLTYELYGIDHAGQGWGETLLHIDFRTGDATEIGALFGDHTEASTLAFNEEGKLYALDNSDGAGRGQTLFTIDIFTGETFEIGALDGHRDSADFMRFGANGTLYGARYGNSDGAESVLFMIDTDNAETTDIGFFHGNRTYATSMAIYRSHLPPDPAYQILAMNSAGSSQGTVLYQVSQSNAATTDIGSLSSSASCATDIEHIVGTNHALYALDCDGTGAGSRLVTVDGGSGMGIWSIPIRDSSGDTKRMTSIAMDPDDGRLFAIDYAGRGWGTTLFQIDPASGLATEIGPLSTSSTSSESTASSIAFNERGKLYGINSTGSYSGNTLFRISTSTGQTSWAKPLYGSRNRATTLRVAPSGTFYGSHLSGGSVLFTIDPDDGWTRDVGSLSGDRTHATSMAIYRK